ncbi:uncharacterized protein LOC101849603, partial [Aplysia californica]|uniref:Uncharacterized protein LOC101849603 n=1 Tax=Aplysia californica TaxID=6500 RepID=A0ABM0ZWV4_APLCA
MSPTPTVILLFLMASSFPCWLKISVSATARTDESPCVVTGDTERGGEYVNCSSKGLTSLQPSWFPDTATTLNLDHNDLHFLDSGTFRRLNKLKVLSVRYSNVYKVQENALMGLGRLEELNLENNNIDLSQIPPRIFSHVPNVVNLYLKGNRNGETKHPHKAFAKTFSDLKQLQRLSLDRNSTLYLGQDFASLENLIYLHIDCSNVTKITNESLAGFQNVSLQELVLASSTMGYEVAFETGVFRYLETLQVLRMKETSISNKIVLRSLWPFENKTMTVIQLESLGLQGTWATPEKMFADGDIKKDDVKYLRGICFLQLIWNKCSIGSMDSRGFDGPSNMKRCVRSLQFTKQLLGRLHQQRVLLLNIFQFQRLEELQYGGFEWCGPDIHFKLSSYQNVSSEYQTSSEHFETFKGETMLTSSKIHDRLNSDKKATVFQRRHFSHLKPVPQTSTALDKSAFSIKIPKTLKQCIFFGSLGVFPIHNFHVWGGENFREFRYVSSSRLEMYGIITGLENTTLVDITRSEVKRFIRVNFFKMFPNAQTIILNSLASKDFLHLIFDERWFDATPKLEHVEVSDNRLHSFPRRTFSTNWKLTTVVLTQNKFTSLGLDVSNMPALKVLDLRHNAISTLEQQEMTALDKHPQTKAHGLSLLLGGNPIHCLCSRLSFLIWLHTTLVRLDNSGNYTCTDDRGYSISTGDLATAKAIWRRCEGRRALLVSFCLLLALAFGFMTLYKWRRFKTA